MLNREVISPHNIEAIFKCLKAILNNNHWILQRNNIKEYKNKHNSKKYTSKSERVNNPSRSPKNNIKGSIQILINK